MLNRQTFFDTTARHLLTQGCKAVGQDEGGNPVCRYRDDEGNKCALGAHIPDEYYLEAFEGLAPGVGPLFDRSGRMLAACIGLETEADVTFARSVQAVHDFHEPGQWAGELRLVAERFGLNTNAVDALAPRATEEEVS